MHRIYYQKTNRGLGPEIQLYISLFQLHPIFMNHLKNILKSDISKAFDNVWHEGVIHKLKCNDISGNLLDFFENYLEDRHQRVVLNVIESDWKKLEAGVPGVSSWTPSISGIFQCPLTGIITSQMGLFADVSSLLLVLRG